MKQKITTEKSDIELKDCFMNTALGLLAKGDMNCATPIKPASTGGLFETPTPAAQPAEPKPAPTGSTPKPGTILKPDERAKMEQERVYTDCTLTLDKLAKQLGTNRSTLSKAINTGLGVNFTTYLNSYRIKEAIRIFNEQAHSSLTMESIGQLCGFNTRQAFHRAFKHETGMNMRQYLKKIG